MGEVTLSGPWGAERMDPPSNKSVFVSALKLGVKKKTQSSLVEQLHYAARRGDSQVVRELITRGVDVNSRSV